MRVIKFILLLIIPLLCSEINSLQAQNNCAFNSSKHRIGFLYGYGNQRFLNPSYDYHVQIFQFQYYFALERAPTWSLDLLFQPQFNLTSYRDHHRLSEEANGHEYGLNTGILIRKNWLNDSFSAYMLFSLGPHHISGAPARQSSGFIFSDNIFVGINFKLSENVYLDIRPGFRHMSNANLQEPNGGINNMILNGGILININ